MSGIILAGGESSRLNGADKALLRLGEWNSIERIYPVFSSLFDEIILVSNDPLRHIAWDLHIVTDIFNLRSSLTGLHAGLFSSGNQYAFCVACDMPFIHKEAVAEIIAWAKPPWDVVIPETPGGMEPLFAVYSKKCLAAFRHNLEKGKLKIQAAFKKLRVKKIGIEAIRSLDPEFESFFNINTPADLERARIKAAGIKEKST